MTKIYLDWNIFTLLCNLDRIENNNDKAIFFSLKSVIYGSKDNLIIPYSNGHLKDLMKSYKKGERARVSSALEFIAEISNNVCLTQYWNEEISKWHYRKPDEFFNSLIEDENSSSFDFEEILKSLKEFGFDKIIELYKELPHNMNMTQLKEFNPFFASLLPRSQTDNSLYATILDCFDMFSQINSNPTIYHQLRKMFKETLQIDPNVSNFENAISQLDAYLPKTMLNKSFTELYEESNKKTYSKNTSYDKILGTYMQLDFVGFNSDKINNKNTYDNLFNDALHCFYAAHCDIYVTGDKRNYKKSKAIYDQEKIATIVLTPLEFINQFSIN